MIFLAFIFISLPVFSSVAPTSPNACASSFIHHQSEHEVASGSGKAWHFPWSRSRNLIDKLLRQTHVISDVVGKVAVVDGLCRESEEVGSQSCSQAGT